MPTTVVTKSQMNSRSEIENPRGSRRHITPKLSQRVPFHFFHLKSNRESSRRPSR